MKRILQLIGTAACAWALGVSGTASAQENVTHTLLSAAEGSSMVSSRPPAGAGPGSRYRRGYRRGLWWRSSARLSWLQGQFENGDAEDPYQSVLNRNMGGKISSLANHMPAACWNCAYVAEVCG